MSESMRPVALTIAGSDSGGGAGIQADMRVFARIGAFGTSVITAVTAQNLSGVTDVVGIEEQLVRAQIDAVMTGFPVRAVKTGMLWSQASVELVGAYAAASLLPVVVDPVMVATSGARLLAPDAVRAYREQLLPRAALATPNLDEAAVLLERTRPIAGDELFAVAEQLFDQCQCPILLKGGHLAGDPVDLLHHSGGALAWTHTRVSSVDTHGSGCMLSAAIAAHLALGHDLEAACERSLGFVHDALLHCHRLTERMSLAGIEHAHADTGHLRRL